jgi:hypothetical protein
MELVAEFLEKSSDSAFCYGCLARTLQLAEEDLKVTAWRLRLRGGFRVRVGVCSSCCITRTVVAANSSSPRR